MRRLYLFFFLFTPFALQAQDVTGVWQGHFRSGDIAKRDTSFDMRYKFEVQIAQKGKSFEGVTYSYLSSLFYGKAEASGKINPQTQKLILQEGKLLEVRDRFGGGACIMTCFMQYSKSGNEEFLEGTYVSMNVRDSSNCGRGTVFLRKVANSDFYTEPVVQQRQQEVTDSIRKKQQLAEVRKPNPTPPVKKPATGTPPVKTGSTAQSGAHKPATVSRAPRASKEPKESNTPQPRARVTVPGMAMSRASTDSNSVMVRKFPTIVPNVLKDRENQVVKTLIIHATDVTLNIYDDGAIDHDTVSVYLDNRQVVSHAMLTDRPIVVTLHLDEDNDYHEIVMVAENEGEIPPNTSLMIVKAGDKEYEVRITSTEQKNAVIRFKYAK